MLRFLRGGRAQSLGAAAQQPSPAPIRTAVVRALEGRTLFHGTGDVVLDWNLEAIEAARFDTTWRGPVRSARNFAIVHAAMYDAINGVTQSREPFFVQRPALAGADEEAAVASAAFRTLSRLYPRQKSFFRTEFNAWLADVPNGVGEKRGVKYGRYVAERYLAWRQPDGARRDAFYEPGNRPGDWRPTYPQYDDALHAGAGDVPTFAVPNSRTFLPPPPPLLDSDEYTDAYYEVYDLGGRHSTVRTPDQTEIGIFWAYDRQGTGSPVALYNQVLQTLAVQELNTTEQNARLFAMANVAMADAGITAWECKFADNFWRPITGINEADTDGNLDTFEDPSWEPLGAPGGTSGEAFTPPFPAYISGHSTFGAALFRTLENFYDSDAIPFTLTSDELPGVTRTYTSFSQAAKENGDSRIYLGVHWRFDDTEGQATGLAVADHVFGNFFGLG